MDSFRVWIVIQCQWKMIASCPEEINSVVGMRLVVKAHAIEDLT